MSIAREPLVVVVEDHVNGSLAKVASASICAVVQDHLAYGCCVTDGREEACMTGYTVKRPCILIMDGSSYRLRTSRLFGSQHCDLELLCGRAIVGCLRKFRQVEVSAVEECALHAQRHRVCSD